ncbi:MAG TPA: hypothetical protein VLT36_22750 [Candidatus Dormibacteraeota bacterium]|nr:hypothetical protein [Candidatus Dormibacteraeota bacterium]
MACELRKELGVADEVAGLWGISEFGLQIADFSAIRDGVHKWPPDEPANDAEAPVASARRFEGRARWDGFEVEAELVVKGELHGKFMNYELMIYDFEA